MRVYLRQPQRSDAKECIENGKQSILLHRPWVFPVTTESGFMDYLARLDSKRDEGYLVCRKVDDRIVGQININEIIRGAMDGAFIAYWAFVGWEREGYMTEGLALVLDEAFGPLRLHRLEINIQPANTRSLALVKRLGLTKEGFSKRYLKVDGEWRDHERWAVLAEDWDARGGAVWVLQNLRRAHASESLD